jgi:hypothetical protein
VNGEGELVVSRNSGIANGGHLAVVVGIRVKCKQAGTFMIAQKAVAIDAACVTNDSKGDIVLAGSGQIQPLKFIYFPLGSRVEVGAMVAGTLERKYNCVGPGGAA